MIANKSFDNIIMSRDFFFYFYIFNITAIFTLNIEQIFSVMFKAHIIIQCESISRFNDYNWLIEVFG